MANKKSKKRDGLTQRQRQDQLAASKKKSQWNPVGRALLYLDLVFLALSALLEANNLVSEFVGGLCTVIAVLVLLLALWLLFRKKGGPRLR